METEHSNRYSRWQKQFDNSLPGWYNEDSNHDRRWQRRFDSSFTVWYKEDMAVFGWVKHVLGVKVDNYKIFEDGILMCAIANNLCEGCITREEVLYSSHVQRLELSIKAMHTNLGVTPVLNTCAVAEGRGQEELLTYLLKLKESSDELEQQQADIKRDEIWRSIMGKDRKTWDANQGPRDVTHEDQSYTTSQYSSGYFSCLSSLHDMEHLHMSKPTDIGEENHNKTYQIKDNVISGTTNLKEGESVLQNKFVFSLKDKERRQESLTNQSSPVYNPFSSSMHEESLETAQVASTDYTPLPSSNQPIDSSSLNSLKRQETFVVNKLEKSVNNYPQRPQRILKRSSLKVTLSSPPQSPLEKENQITMVTNNIENRRSSETNQKDPEKDQILEKDETPLVTNLNDLLDDSSNTRKFPRSGFDRNVMYSPFSMPFISVRGKKKTSDPEQVDPQDAKEYLQNSSDERCSKKKSPKRRSAEPRSTMTLTMLARMASRAPNAVEESASSDFEPDED